MGETTVVRASTYCATELSSTDIAYKRTSDFALGASATRLAGRARSGWTWTG